MRAARAKIERGKAYTLAEGVHLLKETASAKFDETVELATNLGIDTRQADQQVRGTVALPHGTGKSVRVAVFAEGDNAAAAREAGADIVGSDDLVKRIQEGFLDFDVAIATPDMMRLVGRLGKVLGPRGLMPNPKSGTVTTDIANAVAGFKAGRIEYRADRYGTIHVPVGKVSFGETQLAENIQTVLDAIMRAKPQTAKGIYLISAYLSSTMGPGIKLDTAALMAK